MKDVMIDIETLGTTPGSVILSIGAVRFNMNTGELGDEMHAKIDINSSMDCGLNINPNTLKWWMNQDKEARDKVISGDYPLNVALGKLSIFLKEGDFLWGNSARFDLGLLEYAYNSVELDKPWDFRNERDVRTLVAFKPEIKANLQFDGTKHDALDDCKHQIRYCHETWKTLNYG